ncbi:XRE family transcriptional regulator [Lentzea sp. PSKA42]|uniref:XRE family transcriptional regulator n=1 Tax=Lentzea indica TaxID=2604800 RepID=A0ABX1FPJ4_9PSEU|nr:XRE family transcriptional regulator [Lentzea indica]NKE60914.1 XRE family transcriptional regulator [Lentzea indica]
MPRTERPLESADTELGSFAADLRKLRDKAGKPSYRALASRAHYSAATLSDAAGGKKLPSLAVTLAYVKACDGDEQEWEQRWRAIAAPPDPTGEAPYVGLKAFQKEDADRFVGREKLTAKLVQLTKERPFVGVFGASGSGKSSLLRAGLLPRLGQALILTPGVQPQDECAVRLAQLTGHSAVVLRSELTDPAALGLLIKQHDEDLVLVVDQFEEVFTLCGPAQRDWFVQALVIAPHVVIGVRADFYGHVGRHPELVEALEGAQLLVGPMTTDELRRAITEPAQLVGATVETALVARLVADVAGQAAALPLVQHALVETWHRRRGMTLSLVGYEEAGGVEHAIARTAEAVHSQLTEEQRQIARRIFLRLIALGEGTEDTKRRATREDLDPEVLEHLANARLVTLSEQHAELTHEALIRSWPRLRDWIAEDREALRVHHQLTEAAAEWDGDRDLLYKGARLAQAAELDANSLTEPERAFLTASQADGRRRTRRTRVVISVLSVLVLLLAGTAVFAATKTREATQQRNDALAGRAATEVMRLIPADPLRAARLALAAYAVTPGPVTRDAVLNADAARLARTVMSRPGITGRVPDDADGGELLVATGGTGPATIVARQDAGKAAPAMGSLVDQVVLSADDRRAFTFERSGEIGIWDIADPLHPRQLGVLPISRAAHGFGVNRDGTLVIASELLDGGPRSHASIWDLRDPARPLQTVLPSERVMSAAVAPSGQEVALLVRNDSTETLEAQVWDISNGGRYVRTSMRVPSESLDVAISNNGRQLAVRSSSRIVLWDVSDADEPQVWATVPRVPGGFAASFAFSTDDRQIAVLSESSVDVWDISAKGEAVTAGSFGGFRGSIGGVRYREREKAFGVIDSAPSTWSLRTDLEKVRRGLCRERAVELTDEEWRRYFADVERVPVC